MRVRRLLACALAALAAPAARAGAPAEPMQVIDVAPAARAVSVAPTTAITVTFDRAVDRATVTSATFWAFGRWSGAAPGAISFAGGDAQATLTPDAPFGAGEQVTVILAGSIAGADGVALRSGGYSFQFWAATVPSGMQLGAVQQLTTRSDPKVQTRSYGASAPDLDGDGAPDVAVVNEISADVRVFMNRATGDATLDPFLEPPTPAGGTASPSETGDFDRDGNIDLCIGNVTAGTVSILLGQGDGTFAPQQTVTVGTSPRAVVVLDADGDGDLDVACSNWLSSNLALLLNDGAGAFGAAAFFEGGGDGERGLAVADMNEDGLLDLVVGMYDSEEFVVNLANGDGTFTPGPPQASGGGGAGSWMAACGDLDGDGHDDVASANGQSNRAVTLRGNGDGTLQSPVVYQPGDFVGATDLGDLDGDGDLDWAVSCFLENWEVLRNDGTGTFAFHQTIVPDQIASCATLADLDGDGDLDLALVDEFEDSVRIMRNGCTAIAGDATGDEVVNVMDLLAVLAAWGACPDPCPPYATCPADLDCDCAVTVMDLLAVLAGWSG